MYVYVMKGILTMLVYSFFCFKSMQMYVWLLSTMVPANAVICPRSDRQFRDRTWMYSRIFRADNFF